MERDLVPESAARKMQRAVEAVLVDAAHILAGNYSLVLEWNIDLIVDNIGTLASDEVYWLASGASYSIDANGKLTITPKA